MSSTEEYNENYSEHNEVSELSYSYEHNKGSEPNDVIVEVNDDSITQSFSKQYSKIANIYLYDYLKKKFQNSYEAYKAAGDEASPELKAIYNYKLGFTSSKYNLPRIVKASNNWKVYSSTITSEKDKVMQQIKGWLNELDTKSLIFKGYAVKYLNIEELIPLMKAQGLFAVQNMSKFFRGGKTRRKRSRKNITRRKK